jgi:hypothetical protein
VDTGLLIAFAFGNSGGAVNGAVVKVAASSGLLIGDVSCSIFNRGACLGTGSVPVPQATSGFAIPSLPAGTGLIMVNGLVTARSGGPVSVTLTITPPAGVSDRNPANNSYTMTATAVSPAHAGGAAGGIGGGGGPAVVTTGGGGAGPVIQMSADLTSYVETAGTPGSWPANGNAAYNLKVRNAGPHAADGATITVPASPGLRKWMASCSQYRGPSWNLPIAQIESGFVIPTLPAGDYFECVISAIVTGTPGSDATLTVNAAVPSGVEDPDPANNSAANTLPIR